MRRFLAALLTAALLLSGCGDLTEPDDLDGEWEEYQPFLPEEPPEEPPELPPPVAGMASVCMV